MFFYSISTEWYFRNSLPDQLRPCKDEIPEVQEDYL
jgi:hypothetical protein